MTHSNVNSKGQYRWQRKKEQQKVAVVINEDVKKDSDEPRAAFFDIRHAGDWAGDWIRTVKQVRE